MFVLKGPESVFLEEWSTKERFLGPVCSFLLSDAFTGDGFSKILGRFLAVVSSRCLHCSFIFSLALWISSRIALEFRCKGLSGKYACAIGCIRKRVVRVTAGSCQLLKATLGVRLSPNTSYNWWYSWLGLLALDELDLQKTTQLHRYPELQTSLFYKSVHNGLVSIYMPPEIDIPYITGYHTGRYKPTR